jgi:hypothetical protein
MYINSKRKYQAQFKRAIENGLIRENQKKIYKTTKDIVTHSKRGFKGKTAQ